MHRIYSATIWVYWMRIRMRNRPWVWRGSGVRDNRRSRRPEKYQKLRMLGACSMLRYSHKLSSQVQSHFPLIYQFLFIYSRETFQCGCNYPYWGSVLDDSIFYEQHSISSRAFPLVIATGHGHVLGWNKIQWLTVPNFYDNQHHKVHLYLTRLRLNLAYPR